MYYTCCQLRSLMTWGCRGAGGRWRAGTSSPSPRRRSRRTYKLGSFLNRSLFVIKRKKLFKNTSWQIVNLSKYFFLLFWQKLKLTVCAIWFINPSQRKCIFVFYSKYGCSRWKGAVITEPGLKCSILLKIEFQKKKPFIPTFCLYLRKRIVVELRCE